ncbi:hypothetical protein D3C79_653400 [compost metagenome]
MIELQEFLSFLNARLSDIHPNVVLHEVLAQVLDDWPNRGFQSGQLKLCISGQRLTLTFQPVLVGCSIEAFLLALLQSHDFFVQMRQCFFILFQLLNQRSLVQTHTDGMAQRFVCALEAMRQVVLVDVLIDHRLDCRQATAEQQRGITLILQRTTHARRDRHVLQHVHARLFAEHVRHGLVFVALLAGMQVARFANQASKVGRYRVDQWVLDAIAGQILIYTLQHGGNVFSVFGVEHIHLVDHENEAVLALFATLAHGFRDQAKQVAVIVRAQLACIQHIQDKRIALGVLDEAHGLELMRFVLAVVGTRGIGQHQTHVFTLADRYDIALDVDQLGVLKLVPFLEAFQVNIG